ALQLPVEIVAIQLDLEIRQSISANPFGERLREAIVDALLDVPLLDGVERSDQVIEWHPRIRLLGDIAIQTFAAEFGAQVVAEIVRDEVRTISVVAIQTVRLAKGVVNRGVESARDN